MTRDDVEVLEKHAAFDGYFRVDRYRLRHRLFAGTMSRPITREVFERGHAAGVLPYGPVRDEVVLIEQFRTGALAAGLDPWLLEIIAGIIDAGETPDAVARREAREEAGLELSELIEVGQVILSPGGASETLAIFCGRVDATAAGGIHGVDAEDEDIRVVPLAATTAIAMLDEGPVTSASTVLALGWFARHRERLRAAWLDGAGSLAGPRARG